nr:zinc-dependent metalloprotease [Chitinophagaceae bacterium]
AIQWGYRWTDKSEEADRKEDNRLIIDSLSKNPRLWFGGEGFGNDPRSQTEDLGDNAMKASEYGIRNLKRILKNLPEWTKAEGDRYQNLGEIYGQIVTQFNRYALHVTKNIGGVYETFKSVEENGSVYEPTPKQMQKEAVQWLHQQVFETPEWLLDKNILNDITSPVTNSLSTVQNNVLANALSPARLANMLEIENRFGSKAYPVLEFLSDLKKGIWQELRTGSLITMPRRNLQKTYTDRLISLLPAMAVTQSVSVFGGVATNTRNSDIPSIARGHLTDLLSDIRAAIPRTKDQLSRYHLMDEAKRIDVALNPR